MRPAGGGRPALCLRLLFPRPCCPRIVETYARREAMVIAPVPAEEVHGRRSAAL